jgi:Bacterial conjugation TrbI-like protein
MKKALITLCTVALLVGAAVAQSSVPAAPNSTASQPQLSTAAQSPAQQAATTTSVQPGTPARIAPGSVIPVSLTKTLDAKKAKTGEEVVAKVTQDLKSNSGEILVPKDTKVLGHVTEAKPRNKDQKESQVGIVFDRAVMKDGNTMQMPMSIQAIIGQQNEQNNSGSGNTDTAPSGSRSPSNGARPGMSGSATASTSAAAGYDVPNDAGTAKGSRPPITAQTQGVVGISNLTLSPPASNSIEGSVVTSEKNNVKLESGTMMLLRVNQ